MTSVLNSQYEVKYSLPGYHLLCAML